MRIMKIGKKIKKIRMKFGLKQIDLANSLGVTPQAVSKWEKDENFPDIYLLRKLVCLFDMSLDDLLGIYEENKEVFEATVFCSGLNHFADKAKKLSAKELAQWTNIIFQYMTDIILKYGGIPIKYTGDGFLCFFSGIKHADRAFKAACDIDRIISHKNIVIFLNAGEIYFGLVGHSDYASKDIYGDAVNQAFLIKDIFAKKVKRGIGITLEVKKLMKEKKELQLLKCLDIPLYQKMLRVYKKK